VLLLALFVIVELRSATRCCRCASCCTAAGAEPTCPRCCPAAGFMGALLFVTYYLQAVLGFQPIKAGLANAAVDRRRAGRAGLASGLMPRTGAKPLMTVGSLIAAGRDALDDRDRRGSSYATHVLPADAGARLRPWSWCSYRWATWR